MSADVRAKFAQAVRHHQAGRLDEAIACYLQVLALKPDLASAHNNLGSALCEQGKLEEAEAAYRQAAALQPNLASAHNNLGTLFFERGKFDEAAACYREALAREPDYAEALDNLGAALHRQGRLNEADASIRRALAIRPDFAGAHDNLGLLLWQQGKPEDALASVRQALALAPNFGRALNNLAFMLKELGRPGEAVSVYRRLLHLNPRDSDGLNGLAGALAAQGDAAGALEAICRSLQVKETPTAKRIFADIAQKANWKNDDPATRHLMARSLTEAWARPDGLARAAAKLLKRNAHIGGLVSRAAQAWPQLLPADELFDPNGAVRLADDELLLALLTSAQNTDLELERFLTMARRHLLEAAIGGETRDNAALGFHAALARQCFINEYVFFHGQEEIATARTLRDHLAQQLAAGASISSPTLLAIATYFPLHSLPGGQRLLDEAWPAPVAAVLTQQLREPEEEAQLRQDIPQLTGITDTISRRVQDQYEENPYPRWIRIPHSDKPITIGGYLRQKFPFAAFRRERGDEISEILSVGCGTGQLALEMAQSVEARLLAIDLSRKSLGYAARKSRELGLKQIEFAQADLMELSNIGRKFDVVECSGVLHHLGDPLEGWRTLLPLLRPGGFMTVGLYSKPARRGLGQARAFIAEKSYGVSADEIRRCRQDLLAFDKSIASSSDFFGISSCRDLLFHVQEQEMQLTAIAAFIQNNGLTFLGFETDEAILQRYRRRFPDDRSATNLGYWHRFEQENPDAFARMYRFWVQK